MNPQPIVDDRLTGLRDMQRSMETRAGALLLEYRKTMALVVKLLSTLAATSAGNNDR